jgi:DNA-binding LytR/AlgR family response regulator
MQPFFFIRTNNQYVKINFADIHWIEADRNYVRIVTKSKTHLVLLSLKQLETILPAQQFCRVHRSYIVSLDQVQSFDNYCIHLSAIPGQKRTGIPIGTQFRKLLYQRINLIASEVRRTEWAMVNGEW